MGALRNAGFGTPRWNKTTTTTTAAAATTTTNMGSCQCKTCDKPANEAREQMRRRRQERQDANERTSLAKADEELAKIEASGWSDPATATPDSAQDTDAEPCSPHSDWENSAMFEIMSGTVNSSSFKPVQPV